MFLAARRAAPAAVLLVCALAAPGRACPGQPLPADQRQAAGLAQRRRDAHAPRRRRPRRRRATATPVAREELARTGSEPLLLALYGLGLLGSGLGLRRLADGPY